MLTRRFLILPAILVLSLFFIGTGWCQSSKGGGFSLSGGVGPAGAVGNAATSPSLEIAEFGIKSGVNSVLRNRFEDPFDLGLTVSLDYVANRYTGDRVFDKDIGPIDIYSSSAPSGEQWFFNRGDHVDARLNLDLISLNGDWDIVGFPYNRKALDIIRVGPRLQWLYYSEYLNVKRTLAGSGDLQVRDATVGFNMVGAGGFASVDLTNLLGTKKPHIATLSLSPKIQLAGVFGKGTDMRYRSWEAVLQLLARSTSGSLLKNSYVPLHEFLPITGFTVDVGYANWSVNEIRDKSSRVHVFGTGNKTKNNIISIDGLVLRCSLVF
jgi:hypothetical protein